MHLLVFCCLKISPMAGLKNTGSGQMDGAIYQSRMIKTLVTGSTEIIPGTRSRYFPFTWKWGSPFPFGMEVSAGSKAGSEQSLALPPCPGNWKWGQELPDQMVLATAWTLIEDCLMVCGQGHLFCPLFFFSLNSWLQTIFPSPHILTSFGTSVLTKRHFSYF